MPIDFIFTHCSHLSRPSRGGDLDYKCYGNYLISVVVVGAVVGVVATVPITVAVAAVVLRTYPSIAQRRKPGTWIRICRHT